MNDDREHEVRERAYALWESEGRPAGRHEDHWHRASSDVTEAAPIDPDPAQPQEAAPEVPAKPGAARRKPAAASPTAADTPSAVQESAPAPRKKRTIKPKAN